MTGTYDVTEEPNIEENNEENVAEQGIPDETAGADEQAEAQEAQEAANESEEFGSMSDDELLDYINSL